MNDMSDQMTMFDFTMPMVEVNKPIRLIELFAGYGSQAMALKRIGADFEHYRVVEFDEFAIKSYNAIHGTDFPTMDVTKISADDLGIIDTESFTYLLTYSFPCTDISVAGQQKGMAKGSGTRSGLLWEVERLLNECGELGNLPQILLMENVVAVHSKVNEPHFREWLNFLQGIGYTTYVEDLNTADYGLPHHRDRCFAVSFLGEYNYKFPNSIDLTTCIEDWFEDLSDDDALRLVVKSPKALDLMIELDEDGNLE